MKSVAEFNVSLWELDITLEIELKMLMSCSTYLVNKAVVKVAKVQERIMS